MPDLRITRLFDAPRELVYGAWTDPDRLTRWLGPKGFTGSAATVDARPGGVWRACITSPGGDEHWMRGVYHELDPPARIVFGFSWETEGDLRTETLVTVELADLGGKTEMTFSQSGFPTTGERDGHHTGWTECFERLAGHLHGKEER
jgi:uncharacterized protein YndB with AHSA1/START domain